MCFASSLADVDRIIFVPGDRKSGPGILGIREPCFNAGHVLLPDMTEPGVLVPLTVGVHLKHVPDKFASHRCMRLDLVSLRFFLPESQRAF